jgi:hypothetical protein
MVDESIAAQEQEAEQELQEAYWKTASEDERKRRTTIDETIKSRQSEGSQRVAAVKRAHSQSEEREFETTSREMLEDLQSFNTEASGPSFSQKARAAAYALHKKDPGTE